MLSGTARVGARLYELVASDRFPAGAVVTISCDGVVLSRPWVTPGAIGPIVGVPSDHVADLSSAARRVYKGERVVAEAPPAPVAPPIAALQMPVPPSDEATDVETPVVRLRRRRGMPGPPEE